MTTFVTFFIQDANVKACLSYNYDKEDYDDKDKE
jgi:hypothetical protein